MRIRASIMAAWVGTVLYGGFMFAQVSAPPASGNQPSPPQQTPRAQPPVVKNPSEGNPQAIRLGRESYRSRCASCHGADAKGGARGSDLTGLRAAGGTDQQLFQSIRRGVPNTLLRHSFGPDDDTWAILAYLRSINADTSDQKSSRNVEDGQRLFEANCSDCHRVNGRGGRLGPDLSQVGSSRLRPTLAHKVRHASSYIMNVYQGGYVIEGYQPVTLVTRDGQRIRGVKKNEDAFSIQIMDARQRLQGYLKDNLREVINDTTSLMPDFGPDRLNDRDFEDLLAYLGTLRAAELSGR